MRPTLALQISILCLLLALIPTTIVAIYGSSRLTSSSTDLTIKFLESDLYLLADDIRQIITRAETETRLLSQADVFEREDRNAILNYLEEIRVENAAMLDLAVLDLEGIPIATTKGNTLLPAHHGRVPDPDISRLIQQAKAGEQGDVFLSGGWGVTAGRGILVSTPITDERNATVIKVLMVFYSIESLRSEMKTISELLDTDLRISLVEDRSKVVATTDPDQLEFEPLQDAATAGFLSEKLSGGVQAGRAMYENDNRDKVLSVFSQVIRADVSRRFDWTLVASVPEESLSAPIDAIRNEVLFIAAACALLALFVGLLAARSISRPLSHLVMLAEGLSRGESSEGVLVNGPSEIIVLRDALAASVKRIAEHSAALERTTSDLKQAQQLARIGSWDRDLLKDEVRWSDEQYQLLGYEPGAVMPSHALFLKHVHEKDREMVAAAFADAVSRRETNLAVDHLIKSKGAATKRVRTTAELRFDESGHAIAMTGTSQDITSAHQLEEQFRQAQKMEAVGQLTGGIAHDFNNLLTVVMGNLELLQTGLAKDGDAWFMTEQAMKASERGAMLTQRLLAFSRRQSLQPRVVHLNQTVRGMQELLSRTLGERVELEFIMASDLWLCEVDPAQVESALLNLAINARDALHEAGKLTFKTANVYLDEAKLVEQMDLEPGHYVLIAVTDNGSGMSDEVQRNVFNPFFTTKDPGKGSGLGLSMVHGFVKQSGGDVRIYSEEGLGTTVEIYLPRSYASRPDSSIGVSSAPLPRGRGERILIVEDDSALLKLCVAVLGELGYGVLHASDGASALDIVDKGQKIDLLLSDVVLTGGMSGPQVARRLQVKLPDLPVLFMSGYTADAIASQGRADHGIELLQKPFRKIDLARAVRKALEN